MGFPVNALYDKEILLLPLFLARLYASSFGSLPFYFLVNDADVTIKRQFAFCARLLRWGHGRSPVPEGPKKNRRSFRSGGLEAEGTKIPLFPVYQSTCARMPKPLIVAPSKPAFGKEGIVSVEPAGVVG